MVASVPLFTSRSNSMEGNCVDDDLGEFHLERGGRSVARAPPDGLLERLDYSRMGVTQDQRTPGEDVVHVAVAVDVVQIGAFSPLYEARRSADRAKGPHRTVDPARHQPLRLRPRAVPIPRCSQRAPLQAPFSCSTTWLAVIWLWCTQSGRPTPRYGLPVTQRPGGRARSTASTRFKCSTSYCAIRPVPPIDAVEQGFLDDPHDAPQLFLDHAQEFVVVQLHGARTARAAEEDPQQRVPFWGAVIELGGGPGDGVQRSLLAPRHQDPEPTEPLDGGVPLVSQRHGARADVADGAEDTGRLRADRGEQSCRIIGRDGKHHRVGLDDLVRPAHPCRRRRPRADSRPRRRAGGSLTATPALSFASSPPRERRRRSLRCRATKETNIELGRPSAAAGAWRPRVSAPRGESCEPAPCRPACPG